MDEWINVWIMKNYQFFFRFQHEQESFTREEVKSEENEEKRRRRKTVSQKNKGKKGKKERQIYVMGQKKEYRKKNIAAIHNGQGKF